MGYGHLFPFVIAALSASIACASAQGHDDPSPNTTDGLGQTDQCTTQHLACESAVALQPMSGDTGNPQQGVKGAGPRWLLVELTRDTLSSTKLSLRAQITVADGGGYEVGLFWVPSNRIGCPGIPYGEHSSSANNVDGSWSGPPTSVTVYIQINPQNGSPCDAPWSLTVSGHPSSM